MFQTTNLIRDGPRCFQPRVALASPRTGASLVVLKAIDHQTIGVARGVRNIRQIPGGSHGKGAFGVRTLTTRVYPKTAILSNFGIFNTENDGK